MIVTRRYRFCASHRLDSPALSAEENRELYGKCNNPYGHGHDYMLEVSVRGPVDPETGLVVDVAALDALVRRRVVGPLDHSDLNSQAPEFASAPPTTENLARVARARLEKDWLPGLALDGVRLHETPRNRVELRNGDK